MFSAILIMLYTTAGNFFILVSDIPMIVTQVLWKAILIYCCTYTSNIFWKYRSALIEELLYKYL